jgi:hypothetical protein
VWFGSTEIDGVNGAELLLRMSGGPHSQWFQMFTWRDQRLVVERNPSITDGYQEYGWVVDSAFSEAVGLTCTTQDGVRLITETALAPADGADYFHDPNALYTGQRTTWRWQSGRWTKASTEAVTMPASSAAFHGVPGWHCEGIPQGTG